MRKEEASGFSCVLVGTYRTENADWIRREKLYNLPLDESADPSVYRRFTAVVLYAGDAAPLTYAAEFSEVVDREWLKANGYSVAKVPHGNRYALFALGEKTSAARVLSNPKAEVFVCSTRWTGKIDAGFYSKPLPSCGGESIPSIFEKLRPYFRKWKSAYAFNPVQMDFFEMIDRDSSRLDLVTKNQADGIDDSMIDLFAGAGGLSEGLEEAGFHGVFAGSMH